VKKNLKVAHCKQIKLILLKSSHELGPISIMSNRLQLYVFAQNVLKRIRYGSTEMLLEYCRNGILI